MKYILETVTERAWFRNVRIDKYTTSRQALHVATYFSFVMILSNFESLRPGSGCCSSVSSGAMEGAEVVLLLAGAEADVLLIWPGAILRVYT